LIEDNAGDARLIGEMLKCARGNPVDLERANGLAAGLSRLGEGGIDAVLLDLSLPESRGLDTFERVSEQAPDLPTIVLTGLDDEELALAAVRKGAQDYLIKGEVDGDLLVRSLRYAIERKRIQKELETANRVKNEFLSIMSHELRTPLGIIMMYAGMAHDKMLGEINSEQERAVGEILNQSDELLGMIKNILEATKFEAGRTQADLDWLSPVSFLNDLRGAYGFSLAKGLTLEWDYPSTLPLIRSDCEKLKQILHNLIHNALKFTAKGGVTVCARHLPDRGAIEFKVTDTGTGIPDAMQNIIFEMFRQVDGSETRAYGGMGLGLYIVKTFAETLGGSVRVDSRPGRGSTFTVTVPVDEGRAEA